MDVLSGKLMSAIAANLKFLTNLEKPDTGEDFQAA